MRGAVGFAAMLAKLVLRDGDELLPCAVLVTTFVILLLVSFMKRQTETGGVVLEYHKLHGARNAVAI